MTTVPYTLATDSLSVSAMGKLLWVSFGARLPDASAQILKLKKGDKDNEKELYDEKYGS